MYTESIEDHYEFKDGELVKRNRKEVICTELITIDDITNHALKILNSMLKQREEIKKIEKHA